MPASLRRAGSRERSFPRRRFHVLAGLVVVLLTSPARGVRASDGSDATACSAAEHALTFANGCPYPIWLGELGNAAGFCRSDGGCLQNPPGLQFCNISTCSSDADCPAIQCAIDGDCPGTGATCSNGRCTPTCQQGQCACKPATGCPGGAMCESEKCVGGLCQYTTYPPPDWQLTTGNSATICIPAGWGGRFWGRTGCTRGGGNVLTCRTGQCGPPYPLAGQLQCHVSANPPTTLFEPTFDSLGVDFYDVSLVSGYNVPLEVTPSTAGCVVTGACTSDLNATCPVSLGVTGGSCTTGGDCADGGACVGGQCVVGCMDPCDQCSAPNPPAALDCPANRNFYCCEGAQKSNSCNSGSATCFDDNDCKNLANGKLSATCDATTRLCLRSCTSDAECPAGTCDTTRGQCTPPLVTCSAAQVCPVPKPPQPPLTCDQGLASGVCVPGLDCCGPYNPQWLQAASVAGGGPPWVATFKAACPTAYSYQFDDPTSTFTCAENGGQKVNYTISFCPLSTPTTSAPTTTTATTTSNPSSTTITSTTSMVTTTTTLSGGCPMGARFESVNCRLSDLVARVGALSGPRGLRRRLLALATKATNRTQGARQRCASGRKRKTRALLAQAIRALGAFRSRAASRAVVRKIPGAAALGTPADALRNDLRSLRAALTCGPS